MKIDYDHRIQSVRQVESPNFNDRPDGERISLAVIHAISLPPGKFGGKHIENLFTNSIDFRAYSSFESLRDVRVSSHLLVSRDGFLTQFVPFNRRAWHAGKSQYLNRSDCNDFSIGIELEGSEHVPFTDFQYESLCDVLRCLRDRYPDISRGRIVGHNEVAQGRKWDPGRQFDWTRVMRSLA